MYSTFDIIVKPLIGAVIGYATNKVAIKMLFRPYTQKKILGINLPFTPGVIPRERERIASSLGDAVGKNLLTVESLEKKLLSEEVVIKIKSYLLEDKLNNDFSVDDAFNFAFSDNSRDIKERIFEYIIDEIMSFFELFETRANIKGIFSNYIIRKVGYSDKIGDVLTENIRDEILSLISDNRKDLESYFKDILKSDKVRAKISDEISSVISSNFGPLGTMFVDSENISGLVLTRMEAMLEDDDISEQIMFALKSAINSFREKTVSSVLTVGMFEKYLEDVSSALLDEVYKYISYKNISEILDPVYRAALSKKISFNDYDKEQIELAFEDLYAGFIRKNLPAFLEMLNFSNLVEREINAFSVEEMESMILGIVDKELSAITWFGGLLGFLIGIVYIFI